MHVHVLQYGLRRGELPDREPTTTTTTTTEPTTITTTTTEHSVVHMHINHMLV